jgi:ribosomal protein L32
MALRQLSSASFLLSAPYAAAPLPLQLAATIPIWRRLNQSLLPDVRIRISNPLGALASIPSLLEEIWDGILRAVPKKKTSHMKKRHRQMAGKALKDVTELNRCSGCGRMKRAHLLCPYCVQGQPLILLSLMDWKY